MIEVKIESINKEDLNVDVLLEIANEIFKGNPKEKQANSIKETLKKAPTLEDMKKDLEIHNKIVSTLAKKIKEEEFRRKKEENHLIEKKERTTVIADEILFRTNKKEYKKINATPSERKDIIKYVRKGNKTICTITNGMGVFQGVAIQHPEDKFNYEDGMTLAAVRANKDMYTKLESDLLELM